MRISCTVLALVIMSASPTLADIVDVNFTQNLSGDGTVGAACQTCPGGFGTATLSAPASMSDSFMGTVSFFDPTVGHGAMLTETITQTNSSDSTSFDVNISDAFSLFGIGGQWTLTSDEVDMFGVTFTLTTASLLNLSNSNPGGGGVESNAITLSSTSGPIFSSMGAFNTSLLLGPGTYSLSGIDVYMFNSLAGFVNSTTTVHFDLSASLSPVPEPRNLAFFAVILLVIFGCHRNRSLAGR